MASETARRKLVERNHCALVRRNGRVGRLVEPHLLGIEAGTGVVHHRRRLRRQPVEVLAVQPVDEVDLAAAEAHHLDIAVGLDAQAHGIEIGQLASRRIAPPVVGIALQQHVGIGLVVGHVERPQGRALLVGRARGDDRHLVEELVHARHRRGKSDGDARGRIHVRAHGAGAGTEGVAGGRVQRRVHQPLRRCRPHPRRRTASHRSNKCARAS